MDSIGDKNVSSEERYGIIPQPENTCPTLDSLKDDLDSVFHELDAAQK